MVGYQRPPGLSGDEKYWPLRRQKEKVMGQREWERKRELFDEVLQIVKKQDDDMLDIARRIVAKAKPYIIEAAKVREQYVDIDISEEKLTMDQESAWGSHLLKGGLQGFTIRLTGNEHGLVTDLRVTIPPPPTHDIRR
jgi:hypothetical protein